MTATTTTTTPSQKPVGVKMRTDDIVSVLEKVVKVLENRSQVKDIELGSIL